MTIEHVRDLASGGVITDQPAFNLPVGTWSWGENVRFRNKAVTRAPVFRTINNSLSQTSPRFLGAEIPSSGFDSIFIGYLNGKVSTLISGVETDVSVSGYSASNSEDIYTECFLGDVYYLNRGDRSPWAFESAATKFVTLPNWAPVSSPWTCGVLRSCNSALVALNVTQNGTNFSTMVITSEFAVEGAVPTTWDYTAGTNNATQNVLSEMTGGIVDACTLGNVMFIYSQNETWQMFLSGDENVWDYLPVFDDAGAISANCVVEVDKKQYVFGLNDIWVHDGVSKASISDERVREFIYSNINLSKAEYCGVTYNKNLKELYFRFMSGDRYCAFNGADGCNRQAVFHIPTNTWSFDGLPFIFGASMANVDTIYDWDTVPGDWNTFGGTWLSQRDSAKQVLCMIGDVNSGYSLTESVYAFDLQGPGSLVGAPVDTHATKGWTLIRDGLDLHEVGAALRDYDTISSIYPQFKLETGAQPITFSFGSADYFNETVAMSAPQTYDGAVLYRLDYNAAGRYLFMEITHNDYHYVQGSALDLDVDVTGDR